VWFFSGRVLKQKKSIRGGLGKKPYFGHLDAKKRQKNGKKARFGPQKTRFTGFWGKKGLDLGEAPFLASN